MREVAVVICGGKPVYWHQPATSTASAIPDSRVLWDFIWEHRYKIDGIGHSHPGFGYPGPSREDLTTFQAVEAGIGRRLLWWIASSNCTTLVLWHPVSPRERGPLGYNPEFIHPDQEPLWISTLRVRSIES